MSHARLHLTDGYVLRALMHRAPDDQPLTVRKLDIRDLAEAVGVSKSKIHALLSGERPSVTREVAERICSTLGVHTGALFFEPLPTPMGVGSSGGERHDHERAIDADASRGSQELGGHDGPIGPYRCRP